MQRLKEEIRKKIIEVGKLRFKKNGYENTSMKDIANDVGISTGNIYRYFLTKKHLLNEILNEIEVEISDFINNIPSDYENVASNQALDGLIDLTLRIAGDRGDTLKVMFNSENERQYMEFKNQILDMFTNKIIAIVKSINKEKEIDSILVKAIARAQFEGFTFIVKNNMDDIDLLKKNLEIYKMLMLDELSKKVMDVMKNDR